MDSDIREAHKKPFARKSQFEVGAKPQIFFAHITNLTTRSFVMFAPDLAIKPVKAWDSLGDY